MHTCFCWNMTGITFSRNGLTRLIGHQVCFLVRSWQTSIMMRLSKTSFHWGLVLVQVQISTACSGDTFLGCLIFSLSDRQHV